MKAVLGVAVALLAASVQAGFYAEPVVNLDAKTFKKVMATEHAAMVAFVAPWCGHCKTLSPEFTAAASSLSPLIPFYAVDCDANQNKALCGEYGIQGFPTIKAFPRAGKGAARDYQGERKRGALIDYAKGLVPDRVKKLRVDEGAEKVLSTFLSDKPTLPHALLIHPSTPSIPFLWKVLGHRLSSKMHLGYVKDSPKHDILNSLGIYDPKDTTRDATRAVVWQPGSGRTQVIEYNGAMKFNALLEFLQSHLTQTTTKGTKGETKKDAKSDKANARKAEKVLQEERIRDKVPSGTEDSAPEAVPAEGVSESEEWIKQDGVVGEPAPPEAPAAESQPVGQEPVQTPMHEEL